jgi:hypothetical protein
MPGNTLKYQYAARYELLRKKRKPALLIVRCFDPCRVVRQVKQFVG